MEFSEDQAVARAAHERAVRARHERKLKEDWETSREFISRFAQFLKKYGYEPVPVFVADHYHRPLLFFSGRLHFKQVGMGWALRSLDDGPVNPHAILDSGSAYRSAVLRDASAPESTRHWCYGNVPRDLPRSGYFITVDLLPNRKDRPPTSQSQLSPADSFYFERIIKRLNDISASIVNGRQNLPGNIDTFV